MEKNMTDFLSSIFVDNPAAYGNMTVFPLMTKLEQKMRYVTLSEALREGYLTVSEITEGGSVPELKVKNVSEENILLLDGEEVKGARQNRVLNTTIMIIGKAETVIPVSCTEQGRWSYTTKNFEDAGVVMAKKVRCEKSRIVTHSLEDSAEYRSDQGIVWDGIQAMEREAKVCSKTKAMNDVFKAKKDDLQKYLDALKPVDGQKGILIAVHGEIAGMDILSSEAAYKEYHDKLLKSYAMDAILKTKSVSSPIFLETAQLFITETMNAQETIYPSKGYGRDHRFTGTRIVGSSLECDDEIIHAAFFRTETRTTGHNHIDAEINTTIAGYQRRKHFRSN
jgi:hypothetical protein